MRKNLALKQLIQNPKKIEYEKSCENSKEILNQYNLVHEILSLETLLSNVVSSNIVEIEEMFDISSKKNLLNGQEVMSLNH